MKMNIEGLRKCFASDFSLSYFFQGFIFIINLINFAGKKQLYSLAH